MTVARACLQNQLSYQPLSWLPLCGQESLLQNGEFSNGITGMSKFIDTTPALVAEAKPRPLDGEGGRLI
jgi:hypothetical protein